jgi:hypothetical protein
MEQADLLAVLAKRIADLQQQRGRHIADANACDGAIQALENVATMLQAPDQAAPAAPTLRVPS